MTWGGTVLTGNGKLSFRFHIEGALYDWVTDENMVTAAVTGASAVAARKLGLKRDGLTFSDESMLLDGKVKCTGPSIRIADIDGAATYAFTFQGDDPTWLTASVTDVATALTVMSNTGYATGDIIHINTEAMYVTSVSGGTTINVNRGVYGTQAQYHYTNDTLPRALFPEVSQMPISLEGRRCRLYVYGEGDSPTGSGTLVWNGVVLGDPESHDGGVYWEIATGGLDRLLDQEMGFPVVQTMKPRGIYYSAHAPLYLLLQESSTASYTGSWTTADPVVIMGFYETQSAFINALNTAIQTAITAAAFTASVFAREKNSDSWELVVRQGSTARFVNYALQSPCDVGPDPIYPFEGIGIGVIANTMSSNTEYVAIVASGPVRSTAFHTDAPSSTVWLGADPSLETTYPRKKVYLDGDLSDYSVIGAGSIVYGPAGPLARSGATYSLIWDDPSTFTINTSENSITFSDWPEPPISASVGRVESWGSFMSYETAGVGHRVERMFDWTVYPATIIDETIDNIGDFMSSLCSGSAQWANAGFCPLISTSEFNSASSSTAVNAAIAGAAYGLRQFGVMPRKKLSDILSEELKLIGCYLAIGGTGKLTIKLLESPNSGTNPTAIAIDAETADVKAGLPTWQRNAQGMVGVVDVQDGWDPREEKHTGQLLSILDASSCSTVRTARKLSIRPYAAVKGSDITLNDAVNIAATYFGMFGYPYANITANFGLNSYGGCLVGKVARVESRYLFDPSTGARWTSASIPRNALITGRKVDLPKGRIASTMYMPLGRTAGYAPSVYVDSATGATTSWTLTVSASDPISSTSIYEEDAVTSDYFAVGDAVILSEWDVSSSSTYSGSVTAVSGNDITVTFDSAWGGMAGSDWMLTYDLASDAGLQSGQRKYCYVASSAGRVSFSAGAKSAFTFGG